MEEMSKPLLVLRKFKELKDLMDSMSREELETLLMGIEISQLEDKYPNAKPIWGDTRC